MSNNDERSKGLKRSKRRGIVEKRRRDRINNSLDDLKRLVPTVSGCRQTVEKLEKAEILHLTVDYLKHLQYEEERIRYDYKQLGFEECLREINRYLIYMEGINNNHYDYTSFAQRLAQHLREFARRRSDNNHHHALP